MSAAVGWIVLAVVMISFVMGISQGAVLLALLYFAWVTGTELP
jgi:hypothetical protein